MPAGNGADFVYFLLHGIDTYLCWKKCSDPECDLGRVLPVQFQLINQHCRETTTTTFVTICDVSLTFKRVAILHANTSRCTGAGNTTYDKTAHTYVGLIYPSARSAIALALREPARCAQCIIHVCMRACVRACACECSRS